MANRTSQTADQEDIVVRGVRYTKEQVEGFVGQAEEYVRENPGQALLYAFVAGYVLIGFRWAHCFAEPFASPS